MEVSETAPGKIFWRLERFTPLPFLGRCETSSVDHAEEREANPIDGVAIYGVVGLTEKINSLACG